MEQGCLQEEEGDQQDTARSDRRSQILKQVKSNPEHRKLENSVNRIRRSQKGDLMLELHKSNDKTAEKFLGQVEKSLGQQTEVRVTRPEVTLECKDIDEATTKEDVRTALKKVFESP